MQEIDTLRIEGGAVALGADDASPRFSWTLRAGSEPVTAVEFEAQGDDGETRSTGRIPSTALRMYWPFAPLESRERVAVRVRVWGASGQSDWSAPFDYEVGLLEPSDWVADFVSPSPSSDETLPRPAHYVRADLDVSAPIASARLYVTAHGMFEARLNGAPVSDELFAPGWSSYEHRLRYRTYDVTDALRAGANTLGAIVADGWYRGKLGFNGGVRDVYGPDVALLAQLEVTDTAGVRQIVDLSDAWRTATGAIVAAGLYEGEHHDARLEPRGWDSPGFDDSAWRRPVVLPRSEQTATLVAPTGPPVRVIESITPVSVIRRPNGRLRLDFGQNISGRLRIRVSGEAGRTVVLHHAEVLDGEELAVTPLRGAPSIDRYVLAGGGSETWAPRFTFHGFRYAELENWPGDVRAGDVVAEVVHSDMVRTGWFSSSNPMLDRLHENVVWSMRDNFVDLPTDCPQRDERLGWTGDIQVFGPTAAFLYDVTPTLRGWLRDVAVEQEALGTVPNFVPWVECGFPLEPAAAWGDVAVILPWVLYERTGDERLLAEQYPSMCAWVEQVHALTGGTGLWDEGFQLGDWLDPAAPPERPDASRTDARLVATAYHARTARILERVAGLLGRDDDAQRYRLMADRATTAFRSEFVSANGRVVSDTETALSLALVFDLLADDAQRDRAGRRLVELVVDGGHVIRTGFVGTPILCEALALAGAVDTAYHLLAQTDCPSWLYPITMGATTIWERWDSMLPDGSINPGEMTSFNHYSLGAVAEFLHSRVGGLRPTSPGYETFEVAPLPGGGLESCAVAHESPFGRISVAWSRAGETLTLDVSVPPGTRAEVLVPGADEAVAVGPGEHRFDTVFRDARHDPQPVRRINIHNPEESLDGAA
ncbi:glycoside hydrolase family 78 protein [Agromyces atrinae]|uniref:glycoside hydrolase family 78 protein n=1 Tax=Agromyces atrinae TaxID=592376 RepID=UPI001F56A229|nr:glycoside hydrolase family 78 protein [Agromyces atrinae]MCI2957132.1 glycoside hydrolase family 78 protein [Agromyces atrinae]